MSGCGARNFLQNMHQVLTTLPYDIIRLITRHLPLICSVRFYSSCSRLSAFLDYNHDPRQDNQSAIKKVLNFGKLEIAERLIFVPYVDLDFALTRATELNMESVVSLILNNFVLEAPILQNAFLVTVKLGFYSIAQILLGDARVDPELNNNRAIRIASLYGHTSIVELLLKDTRVNPAANDNYALRRAALYGHTSVVKLLLAHPNVSPVVQDIKHVEAIEVAAANGHAAIVEILLKDGRISSLMRNEVVMLVAAAKGHHEVVEVLMKDPQVNPAANDNYALQRALSNRRTSVVELLMKDPRVAGSLKFFEE